MVTLNVDPANATVETVASRYNREWLQLQDDRKVRGYDLRSAERRSRDFVDPANITFTTTTGTVEYDGRDYNNDTVAVSGTVGAKFDNVPDELDTVGERNALIAKLPDRDEAY